MRKHDIPTITTQVSSCPWRPKFSHSPTNLNNYQISYQDSHNIAEAHPSHIAACLSISLSGRCLPTSGKILFIIPGTSSRLRDRLLPHAPRRIRLAAACIRSCRYMRVLSCCVGGSHRKADLLANEEREVTRDARVTWVRDG
jgi:hypothetical protein